MLKDKIVIVDPTKKQKLVSEEAYYVRIKQIGQGTFGKVYLVQHKQSQTLFAAKQVLQDRRYKNRELSIISRIKHCNIIYMHQYFLKIANNECILTIIMDYIPCSLNLMIKEQRKIKQPFPQHIRKIIIFQLFKALYYMQLTKICHRDLKPPNILIHNQTYDLKICDFGSAKILEKQESNVSYICSRYYRAPELVMQATDYSTQIDVWSVGCIIVQLLTLQPIFPGDSSQQQLIEIIKILGTPPKKYLDLYQKQKQTQYKLPIIKANNWQKVLMKYQPQKQLVDLISKMLTYDTKQRLKPLDGLKHPYFNDLTSLKEYVQKLPHLFYFKDLENTHNPTDIQELEKIYPQLEPQFPEKKKIKSLQETIKKQRTPNTCHQ